MKIIFIVNAIGMQRCIKRIDEFAERGYEVEAYGFDRGAKINAKPKSCDIKAIGYIDISTRYVKRMAIIYQGIKKVLNMTKRQDIVYYLFGLDNAIFFSILSKKKYIYEESDLVHTYIKSNIIVGLFEKINKKIIKKSLLTVFTSEGFVKYHYGGNVPKNTFVIANRLPLSVGNLPVVEKKPFDIGHLSIGFVGYIRYSAIFNFAKVFCEHFPNSNFHFFGTTSNEANRVLFEPLKQFPNCHFHGAFKHPDKLPEVYSQLDVVLSTYDVKSENVRYAEPNKIYEAIYYETPIIVSADTYLAEKVKRLGIGYGIDAMDDDAVVDLIENMTSDNLKEKVINLRKIDKMEALNINDSFFRKLKTIFVGLK